MVKNSSKREKSRAWTPSTFASDSSHSSTLHAISENAMDEDIPADPQSSSPGVTIIHSALSTNNSSNGHAAGDINGSRQDSDDHKDNNNDSDDEDADSHDSDDDDQDEEEEEVEHESDGNSSSSSQDHETSDDSDESPEAITDESMLRKLSQRIDAPKRTRSGSIGNSNIKSKKAATSALSTSPSSKMVVSATPTKKITKKSKVSVKPKSSKGSLSTAAARQATEEAKLEAAKPIVSRFLELENTKLNDKLLQVFMINGMFCCFCPFFFYESRRKSRCICNCFFLLEECTYCSWIYIPYLFGNHLSRMVGYTYRVSLETISHEWRVCLRNRHWNGFYSSLWMVSSLTG